MSNVGNSSIKRSFHYYAQEDEKRVREWDCRSDRDAWVADAPERRRVVHHDQVRNVERRYHPDGKYADVALTMEAI